MGYHQQAPELWVLYQTVHPLRDHTPGGVGVHRWQPLQTCFQSIDQESTLVGVTTTKLFELFVAWCAEHVHLWTNHWGEEVEYFLENILP